METIQVKSLLWDDLSYEVPSTVEEYNALDPKRVGEGRNPVVEDAVSDTIKHKVLGKFRNAIIGELEKKFDVKRVNRGTKENQSGKPTANSLTDLSRPLPSSAVWTRRSRKSSTRSSRRRGTSRRRPVRSEVHR